MNINQKFIAEISLIIHAPTEKVWHALTDPETIKQYFFGTEVHTDWKEGSPIIYTGTWEGKTYEDKGTILKSQPGKLLQHDYWSSMSGTEDKPENYATITYELETSGNDTKLTVIQDNIASAEAREHSERNWKMILDDMKKIVEG